MGAESTRILLIDDDPDMHMVAEVILEPEGYHVSCCRTGSEGLEMMRRRRPDLVLLDIMLTHPSEGLQVACQMRQDERLKDIPIIIISAIGETTGMDRATQECPEVPSPEGFLEKPLDAATVREAVRRVLEQKAADS